MRILGFGEDRFNLRVGEIPTTGADCLKFPYGYLEASISLEGAVCSLEVDALIAATALASKDWPIWLLRPPIQRLTPENKF